MPEISQDPTRWLKKRSRVHIGGDESTPRNRNKLESKIGPSYGGAGRVKSTLPILHRVGRTRVPRHPLVRAQNKREAERNIVLITSLEVKLI